MTNMGWKAVMRQVRVCRSSTVRDEPTVAEISLPNVWKLAIHQCPLLARGRRLRVMLANARFGMAVSAMRWVPRRFESGRQGVLGYCGLREEGDMVTVLDRVAEHQAFYDLFHRRRFDTRRR